MKINLLALVTIIGCTASAVRANTCVESSGMCVCSGECPSFFYETKTSGSTTITSNNLDWARISNYSVFENGKTISVCAGKKNVNSVGINKIASANGTILTVYDVNVSVVSVDAFGRPNITKTKGQGGQNYTLDSMDACADADAKAKADGGGSGGGNSAGMVGAYSARAFVAAAAVVGGVVYAL